MKLYKGNILTVNANNDVVKYLVTDKDKIIYVGNELKDKYKNIETIDLGDKALIPSFVDTHQHFASFSLFHDGLNVMNATSNEEILTMLKDFVSKSKSKLIIAFGASPYSVKENKLVTRDELDKVCPNKPLFLVKYDGHACVLNSILLKKLDKKLSKLRGYHPDTGEMNQEAFFVVSDYVTNSISIPNLLNTMKQSADYQASNGIGMVHTVSGVGFPLDLDITMEKMMAKSLQNGFQLRVFPQSMNIKVAKSRNLPRIGGCFQCALDGCYGSVDAAMDEPYTNDPNNKGILYYKDETVIEFCKKANRAGLQIEMHAIGDAAFKQATRALKIALDDYPRNDHRHSIIHACLPTEEGIEICEKYNICLPMQISFDEWPQEPMSYITQILGEERANRLNPIATLNKRGIVIAFGSDAPCTDPIPTNWLYKAVTHSNPNERISIQDALRMATYNGAYITFDEKERGSLETGKIADMVILSHNPYTCSLDELKNIKVVDTILSGKSYQKQNRTIPGIIFNGLFSKNKF